MSNAVSIAPPRPKTKPTVKTKRKAARVSAIATPSRATSSSGPVDLHAIALETLGVLRAKLKDAEGAAVTSYAAQITAACRQLGQLTGAYDVTEPQILRSAAWRRVWTVIEATLAEHPTALAALVEALEAFEAS